MHGRLLYTGADGRPPRTTRPTNILPWIGMFFFGAIAITALVLSAINTANSPKRGKPGLACAGAKCRSSGPSRCPWLSWTNRIVRASSTGAPVVPAV